MSSEQIEPRPSVMAFARAMEVVLRKHDQKKGGQGAWRTDFIGELVDHAVDEARELNEAKDEFLDKLWDSGIASKPSPHAMAADAIDLANMAMMVWDQVTQRDDAIDPPVDASADQS
jgi:hypothetical protein